VCRRMHAKHWLKEPYISTQLLLVMLEVWECSAKFQTMVPIPRKNQRRQTHSLLRHHSPFTSPYAWSTSNMILTS
jgi:hypothetical protein